MTPNRAAAVAGLALAAVLTVSACSEPEPSPPPSTPTDTPTETPPETDAEGTVEGDWCPTPESSDSRCLAVTLPTVTYDDGTTGEIVGDAVEADDGSYQYSFADAPFGAFYPAGVPIDIPDYYSGDDLPDQDRIWNAQTGVLLVRQDAQPGVDFPADLAGEWSSKDNSEHFSTDELLSSHPAAFVKDATDSEVVSGATDYTICLVADGGDGECTASASMFLRYFPKGVSWDCAKAGDEGKLPFGFTSCDPDFTKEHVSSEPRLIILPSHQHDQNYIDSKPMYRTGP